MNHGDAHVLHRLRAAFVHRAYLLCAFLVQPGAEFKNANHRRVLLLADFHRIANVVEMAVGAKQNVDFPDFFNLSGQAGLFFTQGSISRVFPSGVSIVKVE